MYSRDSYIKMFLELDAMLVQGLEKNPKNEKLQRIVELHNKMFIFTNQLFNKQDIVHIENREIYKKLHATQIELETLKLKQ
jgi:RecA/RadA recombinase|tara:strand:+ start:210 stop:452 length:243 start_codon:yes stop_codon:yes gene_type:complete